VLIDWFTVGAQALNFVILAGLMRRYLYRPILNAVDAREKRIAAELADADAKRADAQKARDELQHQHDELDRQRAALLSKASEEAQIEGRRLLEEARRAADALSAKREELLRSEATNVSQALTGRVRQEVFAIARKTLTDLATTSLEERMGDVFTRRLRALSGEAKARLGHALEDHSKPVVVRSAFGVPEEQRAVIRNAVNETFSAAVELQFEVAPDLMSGIELCANGQKMGWSIADYLGSMEEGVGALLEEKAKAPLEPKPDLKPGPQASPKLDPRLAPKPPVADGRSA
jgi:F-type H+-transporting ATPase subunit b